MNPIDLLKSHVDQYTRKDGTVVQAHDDKRVAAQPHPVGQTLSGPAAQAIHGGREAAIKKFGSTVTRSHMADGGKGIVETHDGYGTYYHHATNDGGKSWSGGYASASSKNKDAKFDEAVGKLGGGAKQPTSTPHLGANAKALAASSKPGELDHEDNQIAAGYMKEGDHKALASHLKHLDTAARDHVLDHIHPDHWQGLGFTPLDHAKSAGKYDAKFGAKPAAKKPAAPKPADKPEAKPAAEKPKAEEVPDDENPKYALSGLSSKVLGQVASGALNIKDHAHHELAQRGLDSDGEWAGHALAKVHHGGGMTNDGDGFKRHQELGEHLQTVHKSILSGAAKGKVDLQAVAKQTLADRGHDTSGKWVGFDAAKKHHGIK